MARFQAKPGVAIGHNMEAMRTYHEEMMSIAAKKRAEIVGQCNTRGGPVNHKVFSLLAAEDLKWIQ